MYENNRIYFVTKNIEDVSPQSRHAPPQGLSNSHPMIGLEKSKLPICDAFKCQRIACMYARGSVCFLNDLSKPIGFLQYKDIL